MDTPDLLRDRPADPAVGVSARHDRRWGVVGGVAGSLAGLGPAVITLAQGEPWRALAGAPYPSYFSRRMMLPTDFYFLALVTVGVVFLLGGLLALRRGRYPRTDGFGATLVGTILASLGAVVLFIRLWAVVHD